MRKIVAFVLVGLCLAVPAGAVKTFTYYLKGFQRSAITGQQVTITDSIPNGDPGAGGNSFTTGWIPIFGSNQVSFQMQASAADSDSIVKVRFANIDTTSGFNAAVSYSVNDTARTNLGQYVKVIANYPDAGGAAGGVSWGPAQARTINIVPGFGQQVPRGVIPIRWVQFIVFAPKTGSRSDATSPRDNSMHNVKILVHVFYDGEVSGDNGYWPLTGTAQ